MADGLTSPPSPSARQGRAISKLQRTVQIIDTLIEHDFLSEMRRLARAERRPVGFSKIEVDIPKELPLKVRLIMEDLGPTFIKIGQLLGTRPDLVPQPFLDEFKNFYDRTKPTPFPEIKALIESELGRPLKEIFATFEETAIASASIGQVHVATLKDGTKVAVKVQHPGIIEKMRVDFEIMRPLLRFIENLFAAARIWQPSAHLSELEEMVEKELDYRNEAANYQKFARNFANDKHVRIPRVHWELSSRRILTLEFIEGIRLSETADLSKRGINGKRVAQIITQSMATQIFEHRLFHADPSPGNVIIIDSETIAYVDFGAVGYITRRRADLMVHLITGLARGDVELCAQSLLDLSNVYGEIDFPALRKDIERVMDLAEMGGPSIADPKMLDAMMRIAENHNMLLPPDFILIDRAIVQFEGLCKRMDPDYEIVDKLTPIIIGIARKRLFDFSKNKEVAKDAALGYAEFLSELPGRVNAVLRKIEKNEIRIKIDHSGGEAEEKERERKLLRYSFTGLVGALVVGLAIISVAPDGAGRISTFFYFSAVIGLVWGLAMLYFSADRD
ncbi:MAG: AarF/ABC1/UbiB kinase family protein [Euryarchaeota archaeon]|nr:AarF/ABC1/UbiB kinase family protein [Euryarchaeota archaeon]